MREILSLDIDDFKRHCRDICDVDQQCTIEASRNINYSVNRSSQSYSELQTDKFFPSVSIFKLRLQYKIYNEISEKTYSDNYAKSKEIVLIT